MPNNPKYQSPFRLTNKMMAQISRISDLLDEWMVVGLDKGGHWEKIGE